MMNLLKRSLFSKLEKVFNCFRSCLQAISIQRRGRLHDVDYTGLNAALRRYEQGRHGALNRGRSFHK